MTSTSRIVFFCDCHNFGFLIRELGDSLFGFMDDFYRRCGECIASRGGRIIKYLGDSILAVFPEDAAELAVAAGACARAEYAALVRALETDVESDLEVGISCGPVQEGITGHESFRAFDVVGECVNQAAMIGHHRGIAVTGPVRARLSAAYETRPLEPLNLKGAAEPLEVWEIVSGWIDGRPQG